MTSPPDIDSWNVTALTEAANFMNGAIPLSTTEYNAVLIAWEAQAVNSGVEIHFGASTYTPGGAAEAARDALVNDHDWIITDGGAAS